ncbi:MAG: aminobenzoate oxygenase [Saccharolobus sp.]|jgi:rubrerythrin
MDIDYNQDPIYPEDNVYPPTWDFDDEKAMKLYRRAKKEQWDEEDLNWEKYEEIVSGLDRKQRLALAYWWSLLSNFDNATPVFAYALVKASEKRLPVTIKALLTTITFDENRHNILCGLAINKAMKGFPFNFKPIDDLERKAKLNVEWVWWNGARYWKGYLEAYKKYTLDILFTSFMMGEAAATTVFSGMKDKAKIPTFKEAFKNLTVDETRHYAFTHLILTNGLNKMNEEKKQFVTKQMRAGFVFLSLITYKAPKEFWKLPPWYQEVHEKMEELANDAGLGLPSIEEREKIWRQAVMRVGSNLKRFNVKIPSMPEIGINGDEDIEIKEDDLVAAIF